MIRVGLDNTIGYLFIGLCLLGIVGFVLIKIIIYISRKDDLNSIKKY